MFVKSIMAPQLENMHNEDNSFPAQNKHPGHFYYKPPTFMLHRNNVWSYLRSIKTRLKVGFASEGLVDFCPCSAI